MISNLHLLAIQSIYEQQRYNEIRLLEGTNQGRPYLDTTGNPTVGIGFNLRGNVDVRAEVFLRMEIDPNASGLSAAQQAAELGYLNQLNAAAGGSYASTAAVQTAFDAIMAARAGNAIFQGITRITNLTTFTMTDPQMQAVFPTAAQDAENKVNAWLADIPQSNERIALVSLAYNNLIGVNPGGSFKSPSLRQAIIDDNRAEAWYEIRYNSNGGASQSPGIASRRITESDLFRLYDNSGQSVGEAEAKAVLRMYTTHRTAIQAYESQFSAQFASSGTATIQFQLTSAITTLIANFAEGRTIDGEVLVGADDLIPGDTLMGTTQSDLMFGENGHDTLKGEAGDDVLYGGEGTDQLTGGTGNDYLDGGAGYDTYVYRINDGQDTISDSDDKGSILYNGQLVAGGFRPANSTGAYTSLDGTFTFVQSGNTLVINNLLTIESYTPGTLGITLKDQPAYAAATRSDFEKIDHYVQVGNNPDGTPIFEPVYAAFFDDENNDPRDGTPFLGGLTTPLGDQRGDDDLDAEERIARHMTCRSL